MTGEGVQHLRKLPALKGLTLNETGLTSADLATVLSKLKGFEWTTSPEATVKEFIRRTETGDFVSLQRMYAPGVYLPKGGYKLLSSVAKERTQKNKNQGEYPYRLEFEFTPAPRQKSKTIYIELQVDRGAVFGREVGIEEE